MNLNAKQIARLIEHNAMLRKSGQKALSHDEVVRFFGPALQFRTSCSPKKPKKPHTIEAHHDRAHASKLGRRERIKCGKADRRAPWCTKGVRCVDYGSGADRGLWKTKIHAKLA